jgi:hypothetical protein
VKILLLVGCCFWHGSHGSYFTCKSCTICCHATKIDSTKTKKVFFQILGTLNNDFKLSFVQKSSRIKVYNALALPVLYREAKIGPSDKRLKIPIDINGDEVFKKRGLHTL